MVILVALCCLVIAALCLVSTCCKNVSWLLEAFVFDHFPYLKYYENTAFQADRHGWWTLIRQFKKK